MKQLTLFAEEPPASPSLSQVSEKEWMTTVVTWPLSLSEFVKRLSRDGYFGKTSPVSCQVTEEKILVPSSGRWAKLGMGGPTESWTLNTSGSPNDAVGSLLSDILETGVVPPRYYLSQKACAGILRRAAKRGKELPERLRVALEQIANPSPLRSGGGCDGGGKGYLGSEDKAFTVATHQDQTIMTGRIAPTLGAEYGDKQGLDNQHIDAGGGYLYGPRTRRSRGDERKISDIEL